MKTSLILVTSLMALSLVACNGGGGDTHADTGSGTTPPPSVTPPPVVPDWQTPGGFQQGGFENVTDYSVCEEGKPAQSIRGNWQANFREKVNGYEVEQRLTITRESTKLTNVCFDLFNEWQASVTVRSETNRRKQTHKVLRSKFDTRTRVGGMLACVARLDAGIVSYEFQGSCLVIKPAAGPEQILIPANQGGRHGGGRFDKPGQDGDQNQNDDQGQDDEDFDQDEE